MLPAVGCEAGGTLGEVEGFAALVGEGVLATSFDLEEFAAMVVFRDDEALGPPGAFGEVMFADCAFARSGASGLASATSIDCSLRTLGAPAAATAR